MNQKAYIAQLENENHRLKAQLAQFSALQPESVGETPTDIKFFMELDHLETLGTNFPNGCLLRMQIEIDALKNSTDTWLDSLYLIYVSPSWEKICSGSRDEVMHNFSASLNKINAEDKEVILPLFKNCLANGALFNAEFRYSVRKETRWLQISTQPRHEGRWIICDGFLLDITERKKIEIELAVYRDELKQLVKERTEDLEITNEELEIAIEELKASNEEIESKNNQLHDEIAMRGVIMQRLEDSETKLRNFIQQSFEGILIFDHEGRIIEWNEAMDKITGLEKKYVLDNYEWDMWWQLYPEEQRTQQVLDDLCQNRRQYMQGATDERALIEDLTLHTSDGAVRHVHVSMFPIITKDSRYFGRIVRDVTQQRDVDIELSRYRSSLEQMVKIKTRELTIAKEKAEESDRLKSAFLANMSHEVRTPLNGIVGLLNILAADPQLPENIREYIDIINSNSEILQRLISDILDAAKLEAGLMAIIPEPVSMDNLMDEMQIIFTQQLHTLNKTNICLENYISDNVENCVVFADPVRLRQIIHNLLNNAVKFTEQGHIRFGYQKIDDKIEISVEDTGIGIPKNQLEHIFQRFRQAELGNNRRFGGTGLGLTISRSLAQLMGGDMYVTSTEGVGSKFTFTIAHNPCNVE